MSYVLMYHTLALPHLQYAILIFFNGRIEPVHTKAVHVIPCSKFNAQTEPLFK